MATSIEPRIMIAPQTEGPIVLSVFPGLGFEQLLRLLDLVLVRYPERAVIVSGISETPDGATA